jgi:hypothetical protein
MNDEEGGSSYTAPSLAHSSSPRCVGQVWNETMLSVAHALFSPDSAEDRSSLFVWFIDTMTQSDSSRACASALWLGTFADRPPSLAGRGALEVSGSRARCFSACAGSKTTQDRFLARIIANNRGVFHLFSHKAEIDVVVNHPQQVIGRNLFLQAEIINNDPVRLC